MFAIVTGGRGQDGQLMLKCLRERGYSTISIVRESSLATGSNSSHDFQLASGCQTESFVNLYEKSHVLSFLKSFAKKVRQIQLSTNSPSSQVKIYHFMCEKQGFLSYQDPFLSIESSYRTTLNLLESIRVLREENDCCFSLTFSGSSEMFGDARCSPQNELTEFMPKSPYAVGKVIAHQLCANYREFYGVQACTCILYNHESNLRPIHFVSQKIIRAVANHKLSGKSEVLSLGNLDAKRDWSHAQDIVEGIYLASKYEKMQDFVLAMGEAHTVREFVCYAFKAIGVNLNWKGEGIAEEGFHGINNDLLVKVDKIFFRDSAEMPCLVGNIYKASKLIGWKKKYNFEEMIKDLVFKEIRQLSTKMHEC